MEDLPGSPAVVIKQSHEPKGAFLSATSASSSTGSRTQNKSAFGDARKRRVIFSGPYIGSSWFITLLIHFWP